MQSYSYDEDKPYTFQLLGARMFTECGSGVSTLVVLDLMISVARGHHGGSLETAIREWIYVS